jgi:hypothetical protein
MWQGGWPLIVYIKKNRDFLNPPHINIHENKEKIYT